MRERPPEPHDVRERAPELSYGPEPIERQELARAEPSAHTAEPSNRPDREPEPQRPERSTAPHEETRPPTETVP
jgi:hypothetical protein